MALDAIIIGAGVSGLSIALELLSRGYNVGIVAKVSCPQSQEATSARYLSGRSF